LKYSPDVNKKLEDEKMLLYSNYISNEKDVKIEEKKEEKKEEKALNIQIKNNKNSHEEERKGSFIGTPPFAMLRSEEELSTSFSNKISPPFDLKLSSSFKRIKNNSFKLSFSPFNDSNRNSLEDKNIVYNRVPEKVPSILLKNKLSSSLENTNIFLNIMEKDILSKSNEEEEEEDTFAFVSNTEEDEEDEIGQLLNSLDSAPSSSLLKSFLNQDNNQFLISINEIEDRINEYSNSKM
jgi:hypothetical protein